MQDLGAREVLATAPLLGLTVLIGVYPSLVLDVIHQTTKAMGL
jgi:NADH:ubiquinone oxidoreductase subunit 4 (subunit M)